MNVPANTSDSSWCEVVIAYGWMRDGERIQQLARRLRPEMAKGPCRFLEELNTAPPHQSRERCRELLKQAGCLFPDLFKGGS